ncbi:MAG: GTPase HflX [Chloroflexi bacterium]|nr:GTPase HflX [Chloroflexota bacterium]
MGVEVRGEQSLFSVDESLDELARLAHTAGVEVVGRDSQRLDAIHPGTFIGSGKVEELRKACQALDCTLIIFDDELSPAQLRTLEQELEVRVMDRTALILDIFALHATSKEGALQVELAQYAYRLPRLTRMWTHLSRQGVGGVGLRGPGETQLESDRREISKRMSQLRHELEQLEQQRALRRRRRRRQGIPVVGIVGYTNAGKSTLLNRISGSEVLVEDKLFATLDPTTRRVQLPSGREVLFTDTVGFIQKLPTQLVAAFHATLEEVLDADLLIHVVDISSRNVVQAVEAVEDVLFEIGAGNKPVILALNKVDLVDPETHLSTTRTRFVTRESPAATLQAEYADVVTVSAQQGVGVEELLNRVDEILAEEMVEVDVTLPYNAGDVLSLWHRQGIVDEEEYKPQGIEVRGKLPKWMMSMIGEDNEGNGHHNGDEEDDGWAYDDEEGEV